MRMGRVRSVDDHRDLRLAHYLDSPAALWAPPARDWRYIGGQPTGMPIKQGMYGNDSVGDCTCACVMHAEDEAAVQVGVTSGASLALAFDGYEAISPSGWKRTNPHVNDDGASIRDSLKFYKARGIIDSYVRLDESDIAEIKVANNLGQVILGWDLPKAAQKQVIWDVSPFGETGGDWARRTWGGHATKSSKADRDHGGVVTWGGDKDYTWPFFRTYCDEAWLVFMAKWVTKATGALLPNGFDLARVRADAARLAA